MAKDSKSGEKFEFVKAPKMKELKGIVYAIRKPFIILDVDGSGVRIAFNESKHKDLKIGDSLEV